MIGKEKLEGLFRLPAFTLYFVGRTIIFCISYCKFPVIYLILKQVFGTVILPMKIFFYYCQHGWLY